MNSHDIYTKYPVTNSVWRLYNRGGNTVLSLSDLMELHGVLHGVLDGGDIGRYRGINSYYVRNCVHALEYRDIRVGLTEVHRQDPWYRKFPIFPYERGVRTGSVNRYEYVGVYDSDIKNYSMYLVTTSVSGRIVYCVDVLAGGSKIVMGC